MMIVSHLLLSFIHPLAAFLPETRGATFGLAQVESFRLLNHKICDIHAFFFHSFIFNLPFLCGCIAILLHFSPRGVKEASPKKQML